jgi:hypothetical protein
MGVGLGMGSDSDGWALWGGEGVGVSAELRRGTERRRGRDNKL